MSEDDITNPAADFPESQVYIHNYLHLIGITILYYDHFITFGEEFLRIWRSPRSGASILFLLNRYFALFVNITVTGGNFGKFTSIEGYVGVLIFIKILAQGAAVYPCSHYSFYRQIVLMATQVLVAAIQFLRTYALYGRSKRVACLILCIAAFLLSVSIWAVTGQTSTTSLFNGCHIASSKTSAIHIAVAWEALFLFDSMIFTLTLFKTYKERFKYALRGTDLVSLIFRDGAIYFGVMVIAQASNVLTFYLCPPALRGVLSTAASAISVTMMSRLMLNLHRSAAQTYQDRTTTTEPTTVCTSSLQFTSRFGVSESINADENDTTGTYHGDRVRIHSAGQITSLQPVEEGVELVELDTDKELPMNFMICPV